MNNDYSVVLTSCARFDLLRRTVESFAAFADIAPRQFIVVEDSGSDEVRGALSGIDLPFELVVHNRQGQARSIDAGYALVKTPHVFHCEDDWEFLRGGFIGESFTVLNAHPQVSAVMLCGRGEHRKLKQLPLETLDGVKYFRARPGMHRYFWGCSYNPGLRRMSDYRRIAPIAKIGGENEVSVVFQMLGFATAHLEIPAVRHLGGERHIPDATMSAASSLRKTMHRWRAHWRVRLWRMFGLPARLRND